MFAFCSSLQTYRNAEYENSSARSSPQEDQTKGEALRFEIMHLDDVDGAAVDSTVVDAASVNRIVQQAAAIGQRIYIRPAETPAS